MKAPFVDRLMGRRIVTPRGCWETTYAPQPNGYTKVTVDGRPGVWLHRWAYEEFVAAIPRGLHVMHKCDNPACWNPSHLTVGTHLDNMRDMAAKGRRKGLRAVARQDACAQGHDLTDAANVKVCSNGKRRCRPCSVAYLREWRARNGENN
jgi:HNH endonuclease